MTLEVKDNYESFRFKENEVVCGRGKRAEVYWCFYVAGTVLGILVSVSSCDDQNRPMKCSHSLEDFPSTPGLLHNTAFQGRSGRKFEKECRMVTGSQMGGKYGTVGL